MTTNTTFYPCGCLAVFGEGHVVAATLCPGCLGLLRTARRGNQLDFLGVSVPMDEVLVNDSSEDDDNGH